MTKKQMEALKPGDIVVEKATGDEYAFVKTQDVLGFVPNGDKLKLNVVRIEAVVRHIPGFEYMRSYNKSPLLYFKPEKLAVKEEQ